MMARKTAFELWRDETLTDIWDFKDTFEWSYKELATHAKLATSTVYKLRTGKTREPRASTVFKLAKSLGLSLMVREQRKPYLRVAKTG